MSLGRATKQASRSIRALALYFALYLAMAVMIPGATMAEPIIVDDFEQLEGWTTTASKGVDVEIAQDEGQEGMALRVDFDFHGNSGFIIVRKELPMTLPPNFAFNYRIRGDAPKNALEFKLIDPEAQNVWRAQYRDFEFPRLWKKMSVKRRHLDFAWGPSGGDSLSEIGALEFAISSERGGKGSIWIDQLTFVERLSMDGDVWPPTVRASTTLEGNDASRAVDGNPVTKWKSGTLSENQWYLLDFQQLREYGGLIIDWDLDDYANAYDVQISEDGDEWETVLKVTSSNGGRDYVSLPDMESRLLRLNMKRSSRSRGYGIAEITLQPYQFSATPNQFFEAIARDTKPGLYPRYLSSQQSYWTVVGVAGDNREALINDDGMVEVQKNRFSIEPFVAVDGDLVTWHDVKHSQELEDGYMPIPSVTWDHEAFNLKVTALATGPAGASSLLLRYTLRNLSGEERLFDLYLALRPFQVSPPWQSLNFQGGVTSISRIAYENGMVRVGPDKRVIPLTKADQFGASRFMDGSITEFLRNDSLPIETDVSDDFGYVSGALGYRLQLPAGAVRDVYIQVPFHELDQKTASNMSDEEALRLWTAAFLETKEQWRRALNRVTIELPSLASEYTNTLRSTLAYMLINADGPALQPGPRAYERSWIRDGSLTSAALLRLGHSERVRDFIRWYSAFQFDDGRVPCCVDWRGADTVPENDSNGQWIYALAEYYRFSHDVGLVSELWPQLVRAVDYIDTMSQERMSEEYKTKEKSTLFGLVPDSISHEGYSSDPAHSYWDNFFALLGLKEAVMLAGAVGETETAIRFSQLRDRFRSTLYASMARSMAQHNIDFIPGAADLGDFDFTATAVAVDPVGELQYLPRKAFERTLELYLGHFRARKTNKGHQEAYTPYEIRIVRALIQMGLKDSAHELLDYFMTGQRPKAWNQWGEIVWLNREAPRFVGDIPHTWVGAEYISALLGMLAYERESDRALVIGAGVPRHWVANENGVLVKRLPTTAGTLNYTMRLNDDGTLSVDMTGDIHVPPGKIVVISPLSEAPVAVAVNGAPTTSFDGNTVIVDTFPAKVEFQYAQ
ncbi:MAG: discoidin domain-containing protein [Rhodospirillales bacterium]|nr:discoidin domain-containing protein [Rhodospirillales bacterium]